METTNIENKTKERKKKKESKSKKKKKNQQQPKEAIWSEKGEASRAILSDRIKECYKSI